MSTTSVLILGATGTTGARIADTLLSEASFHVVAAVRSQSISKPSVTDLKARGAEIREINIETATEEQLEVLLKGIVIVIVTIEATQLQLQYKLVDAAKKAGVKRFIPCDWSPTCIRGVRSLHDEKLAIHDYITKVGIGYTFIDVGLWFPLLTIDPSKAALGLPIFVELSKQITGTGDVKCASIHPKDIGAFISRILRDPRTLNRYIFCYSEEVTQNELFAVAKRISGKQIDVIRVSEEDVLANIKKSQGIALALWEYTLSMWIRGDNTVENAKKPEYGGGLDARELYPDVKLRSLEEYVKEYYLQ